MKLLRIVIVSVIIIFVIFIAICIYLHKFDDYGGLPFNKNQLSLITQKANNGDAKACWCLSIYYYDDDTTAQNWLRKSAEYGYPEAQYDMYSNLIHASFGQEIEALEWLKKAADNNHVFALSELGKLYREGKIVKQDSKESEYWYRKSANNGLIGAMLYLSKFLSEHYDSKSVIIEAYSWAVVAQLRCPPSSSYANEARKQQEIIIKKVKTLGFDKDNFVRESKPIIKKMEKNIPVYNKIQKPEDLFNDCLSTIGS